jgi:hypothetical protein
MIRVGLHEHLDRGLGHGPYLHVVGAEILRAEVQHT